MSNISELRNRVKGIKPKKKPEDFSELERDINQLKSEGFSLKDIHEALEEMEEIKDKGKAKDLATGIYNKAQIFILRHGSTHLNSEDKVRGWLDVPLDEQGQKEAVEMGRELKKENLNGLVSSDLTRAVQTAGAVCKETSVPILEVTMAFRPWDVGKLSGQSGETVAPVMEDYARNRPDEKVDGGESFNDFKDRFLAGIEDVQKRYQGKRIGVVTHHRGDRLFASWEKLGMSADHSVDLDTLFETGIKPGESRKEGEKINGKKDNDLS